MVSLSMDGTRIVSQSWDEVPLQRNAPTRELNGSPEHLDFRCPATPGIRLLIVSPDGRNVLVGPDEKGSVHLFDLVERKSVATPWGKDEKITDASFGPGGKTLLCFDGKSRITLWDLVSGKHFSVNTPESSRFVNLSYSSDGRFFADYHSNLVVDIANESIVPMPELPGEVSRSILLSANGPMVLSTSPDSYFGEHAKVWSLDGAQLGTLRIGVVDPDQGVMFQPSPDGTHLLVQGGQIGTFMLMPGQMDDGIDLVDDSQLLILQMQVFAATTEPTRRDGSVTMTSDGTVQISDPTSSGKEPHIIKPIEDSIVAFSISPKCHRLAISEDASVRFYDTETWQQMAVIQAPEAVTQLQFTADGIRLIVQFADGSAQIWDPRPLAERRKMWARRAAERTPARAYVAKLLANTATTQPADLKKLIRDDPSITPLRKLVALEVLDLEIRKRERGAERQSPSTRPATQPATMPLK
jgi:WD40 repeat protein